jgi:hypothetical protein
MMKRAPVVGELPRRKPEKVITYRIEFSPKERQLMEDFLLVHSTARVTEAAGSVVNGFLGAIAGLTVPGALVLAEVLVFLGLNAALNEAGLSPEEKKDLTGGVALGWASGGILGALIGFGLSAKDTPIEKTISQEYQTRAAKVQAFGVQLLSAISNWEPKTFS